jgi:hypothetical protein
MQFSDTQQILKDRNHAWILLTIKTVILAFCIFFIYNKILENQVRISSLTFRFINLSLFSWIGLAFVALLMPVNWFVEAAKWKFLLKPFLNISASKSIEAVLSGLTFGFVSPRSIGDYFGRAIFIAGADRIKVIMPTIIGRISQLVPTLVGGSIGAIFLLGMTPQVTLISIWGLILLLSILLLFMFYSRNRNYLSGTFLKSVMVHYKYNDYLKILSFSFLRYLVFSLQFLLVLKIVGAEGSLLLLFAGISWIFLAKSILPSFNFLSDLGIREFSAILFFEAYGMPLEPVLIASILIWAINILFPSIVGLFIIGKSKFDLW